MKEPTHSVLLISDDNASRTIAFNYLITVCSYYSYEACLREINVMGRVGGDEFTALLPNINLEDAVKRLERVRQDLERVNFQTREAAIPLPFPSAPPRLQVKHQKITAYSGMPALFDIKKNSSGATAFSNMKAIH